MHYVWYFDSYMWDLCCFLCYHTIWILPQSMRDRTKTSITINNLFHQNDNSHCLSFSSTFECLVFFKKYPSRKISHDCKLSKYNNTFIKIWFTSVTSDYNLFDFAALMIYYWCGVDHLSGAWSTINRWNPRKISKKYPKSRSQDWKHIQSRALNSFWARSNPIFRKWKKALEKCTNPSNKICDSSL